MIEPPPATSFSRRKMIVRARERERLIQKERDSESRERRESERARRRYGDIERVDRWEKKIDGKEAIEERERVLQIITALMLNLYSTEERKTGKINIDKTTL